MAKSFCNDCRHWKVVCTFDGSKFHYCAILEEWSLYMRKVLCGGKLKKEKK